MTIRIFVLMPVAALCLIAASPKNHDVDGDGYGQQMVTEKAARAPGISTSFSSSAGNVVFTTSSNPSGSCTTPDGSTVYTCQSATTGTNVNTFTITSSGSGSGGSWLPLPASR